jgi:hypothetical protein
MHLVTLVEQHLGRCSQLRFVIVSKQQSAIGSGVATYGQSNASGANQNDNFGRHVVLVCFIYLLGYKEMIEKDAVSLLSQTEGDSMSFYLIRKHTGPELRTYIGN